MIVYRFERDGIGPYMRRSRAYRVTASRTKYRRVQKYAKIQQDYWKTVKEEHRLNYTKAHQDPRYLFACSSKEQLKRYFFGDFKILFKEGFRIKRYSVPDHEVMDLGQEVAFPVKYHKLSSRSALRKKVAEAR